MKIIGLAAMVSLNVAAISHASKSRATPTDCVRKDSKEVRHLPLPVLLPNMVKAS